MRQAGQYWPAEYATGRAWARRAADVPEWLR